MKYVFKCNNKDLDFDMLDYQIHNLFFNYYGLFFDEGQEKIEFDFEEELNEEDYNLLKEVLKDYNIGERK